MRDNGDLTLAAGDLIRHTDFGDGKVLGVTGEGSKRIAEVQFETAGRKRLLIKVAPLEKLNADGTPVAPPTAADDAEADQTDPRADEFEPS
jgi:hypothetical protein